ncbi:MAG: DUF488 domain-containing protein [Terracidiphilus sp.]
MGERLKLTMFQCGSPVFPGQGLRIGVTRRPPRGVKKERWQQEGYFDIWMPALAPSEELLKEIKRYDLEIPAQRGRFFDRYERELLGRAESRQTVELIAAIAAQLPVSIGCYCEDEMRCHRSRLYSILQRSASGKSA